MQVSLRLSAKDLGNPLRLSIPRLLLTAEVAQAFAEVRREFSTAEVTVSLSRLRSDDESNLTDA